MVKFQEQLLSPKHLSGKDTQSIANKMEDLTGKVQLIHQVEPQKICKTTQRHDDKEAMQVNQIWKAA